MTADNHITIKRDFQKKIQEFEKNYGKHAKQGHQAVWNEMLKNMYELNETITTSENLFKLKQLRESYETKNRDLGEFRENALKK